MHAQAVFAQGIACDLLLSFTQSVCENGPPTGVTPKT
jgi:hypothetical protein